MNWRAFLKQVYLWKFKVLWTIALQLYDSLDLLKARAIVYFLVNLGFCCTVDELPLVEIELKKANCRQKASKVNYWKRRASKYTGAVLLCNIKFSSNSCNIENWLKSREIGTGTWFKDAPGIHSATAEGGHYVIFNFYSLS
jgi:hypothetical protein